MGWKFEKEFRIAKPETIGETDRHFDLDNYKDWLEEQLVEARSKLHLDAVSGSVCDCRRIGQWSIQECARNSCSGCEKPIRQTVR